MLRLRDCVTGVIVEHNSIIPVSSGRFALVDETSLALHGKWPAGTILLDDGRGFLDTATTNVKFVSTKLDSRQLAKRELALIALENIRAHGDIYRAENLVSPVIPAEIAKSLEPSELQMALTRVLSLGHLQIVAKSPRITMRYDEELLPVSRVKRTASNYQRHLAAHSECWQQRTFTGIVPNKLKAKISEDEVHIYENRVFARLVDHLERYIRNLIARFSELDEALRQGLELDGSASLHRSLRNSVCETWGESFKQGEAEKIKQLSETQLNSLEEQLRKILQLKQTETYRCIPRDAAVPLVLKNTNILHNDQHYTEVRQLWELWVKEIASRSKDYVQFFQQRQFQVECYQHFIGLLLLRAHTKMGWKISFRPDNNWVLIHPSGIEGELSLCGGDWRLSSQNSGFVEEIVFVPLIESPMELRSVPGRILCCLNWKGDSEGIINCSPDNLFSEESVILLVQRWWMTLFASVYGEAPSNLPNAILAKWPQLHTRGVFYALDNEDFNIHRWIDSFHLAPKNKAAVLKSYFSAEVMKFCPCCGCKATKSNLIVRNEKGLKANCELCSASWQIRYNGSEWIYEIGSEIQGGQSGRWCQTIHLLSQSCV